MECPNCENPLQVFDGERTDEYDGQSIDDDGNVWLEWKVDDTDHATFGVCIQCEIMVAQCNACGDDMQLIGHQGYAEDGHQYERSSKTKVEKDLGEDAPPPKDLSKPRYDITDMNKMKFEMKGWHPCGSKGDMHHFWYCPECKEYHEFGTY